jgi:hypothetical protein
MNYVDEAERLLLGTQSRQTEVPYSTDAMERIAAAQVLALLALAEAIKDVRRVSNQLSNDRSGRGDTSADVHGQQAQASSRLVPR